MTRMPRENSKVNVIFASQNEQKNFEAALPQHSHPLLRGIIWTTQEIWQHVYNREKTRRRSDDCNWLKEQSLECITKRQKLPEKSAQAQLKKKNYSLCEMKFEAYEGALAHPSYNLGAPQY